VRRGTLLFGATFVVAAAAVATVVVLVFTGDSKASPTKAEYYTQVAAICRIYGPRLDQVRPPDVAEPANVLAALRIVVPLIRAQAQDVRALDTPKALRTQIERWLLLQDRRVALLERALRAGRAQDFRTMSTKYVAFILAGRRTAKLGTAIGIPHPPC
jgi:hypothetical protein